MGAVCDVYGDRGQCAIGPCALACLLLERLVVDVSLESRRETPDALPGQPGGGPRRAQYNNFSLLLARMRVLKVLYILKVFPHA